MASLPTSASATDAIIISGSDSMFTAKEEEVTVVRPATCWR